MHPIYRLKLTTQMVAEVFVQGVNPNGFGRQLGFVHDVELTSALCYTEADPVRGFVAGSAEARDFHECLGHHRTIPISVLPVAGQNAGRHG